MRWIASLVAEVHRILIRGGLFMYPKDTKDPGKAGRLRLLYEANPMAMTGRAGGRRGLPRARPGLDWCPAELHQRVPLILGCSSEVERIERYHLEHDQGLDRIYSSPLFKERSLFIQSEWTLRGPIMSAKHPIIAVTGSSGAGTTSVTRTFNWIFRRERINAALRRGRLLPSLRPRRDEGEDGGSGAHAAISISATSARTTTCSRSWRRCFATTARPARGKIRRYLHNEKEAAPYQAGAGDVHRWEDIAEGPTCCSTKDCTARW